MSAYPREPRARVNGYQAPVVEICEISSSTTVVTLHGEHDVLTRYRLRAALERVRQATQVIVDLTPCAFIDSSIVGALVQAGHGPLPATQRMCLVVPEADTIVARVIKGVGVRELLPVHASLAGALRAAGEHAAAERPGRA
jgi:anti-anti-sigma factor